MKERNVATIKNEAIYVRTCIHGKVAVYFLDMRSVVRANAYGMFSARFGCDGASVNTGQFGGVIKPIQINISDAVILVHCLAHRLELAFKQSMKGIKLYEKVAIDNTSNKHSKAKYILKLLHSKVIVVFSHFFHDIIAVLSRLSLDLQKDEAGIYYCHEQIESTITEVKKFKERNWPVALNESKSDFGDDFIVTLIKHFETVLQTQNVDTLLIETEWTDLRNTLYNKLMSVIRVMFINQKISKLDWQKINQIYESDFPNILALYDLVLALPASSAVCERGFSYMMQIKEDYRNRLKTFY
ncbi:hypothetical protein KUTeg_011819 [Tegillarca granosa]|uniref:HAT C-terminal dimerisation domain-containing protein n=1 Tax=Tegillarca granosa TaxID=220873 RepID=A0ABQ9EXS0_TEGGR|nr:hypothetical protein KUTeg_011819 [Tegillarca granosa]